jgi:hypothetical protein
MAEILLSLNDVDQILLDLERTYGRKTEDFLRAESDDDIPEDVVFEWKAMVCHKRALEDEQAELHRQYLFDLVPGPDDDKTARRPQELLAA